jgi:uncharacterized protein YbjQ (UPF0145 family)
MHVRILLACLLGLPACTLTTVESSSRHVESAHDSEVSRVDDAVANRVKVVQNDSIGCPTEVLGTVDVHEEVKNEAEALTVLRRRAAALGAEAVLGVEFHHGEGGGEETHLSGMAVRCNDLIKGREYDVISDIEVTGQMEHDEAAFATLRQRAVALHADRITDVHFEHGEGEGKPTRLTGKAIRFRAPRSSGLR